MSLEILFRVPRWEDGDQNGSDFLLAKEVLHKFWEWTRDRDLSQMDQKTRMEEIKDWWDSLIIVGVLAEVLPPNLQ